MDKGRLQKIIDELLNFRDVLKKLGYNDFTNNRKRLKERIEEDGLNLDKTESYRFSASKYTGDDV
jgi:hypothetical protein